VGPRKIFPNWDNRHWRDEKYRVLVGRPEGKRQLGRPQCKWNDTIKWILKK
jgi:hypothetical protein